MLNLTGPPDIRDHGAYQMLVWPGLWVTVAPDGDLLQWVGCYSRAEVIEAVGSSLLQNGLQLHHNPLNSRAVKTEAFTKKVEQI